MSTTGEEGGSGRGGPLLNLLARGLELWLRQQCETIGSLQIHLEGSAVRLLKGQLDGVSLSAERVTYQAFEIDRVDLRSDGIRVRVGPLLRDQRVELEKDFVLRGGVDFSSAGLDRSLRSRRWRDLGDELARQLLGTAPLRRMLVEGGSLVLVAGSEEAESRRSVRLHAVGGTVELVPLQGEGRVRLPMDDAIRIESASVEEGRVVLRGEARVTP